MQRRSKTTTAIRSWGSGSFEWETTILQATVLTGFSLTHGCDCCRQLLVACCTDGTAAVATNWLHGVLLEATVLTANPALGCSWMHIDF